MRYTNRHFTYLLTYLLTRDPVTQSSRQTFYGLGRSTYGLGLAGPGLGLESCVDNFYMQLIINKYLSKSNQNLVHYLSCQAVRRTAYLNVCSGRVLKDLGIRTCGLNYISAQTSRVMGVSVTEGMQRKLLQPVEKVSCQRDSAS